MILVQLESPYAGDIDRNVRYARACMRDCLMRGEAPFASHLLYTQPGILDDAIPAQRVLGIDAGLEWGEMAMFTVVYTDLGVTAGMVKGIARAHADGRAVHYRTLPGVAVMTSSYEQRIVEAMLRRDEALERCDDQAAATALVEAGNAARAMRHQRRGEEGREEESARRDTKPENVPVPEG